MTIPCPSYHPTKAILTVGGAVGDVVLTLPELPRSAPMSKHSSRNA